MEGCENSASTVQNGLGFEHSQEEGSLPAFDLKSGQVTIIQQVLFTEWDIYRDTYLYNLGDLVESYELNIKKWRRQSLPFSTVKN